MENVLKTKVTVPKMAPKQERKQRQLFSPPKIGKENTLFVAVVVPPGLPEMATNIVREEFGGIALEANLDIITKEEASALQSAEGKLLGGVNPIDGIGAMAQSAADLNEKMEEEGLDDVRGVFISVEAYEPTEEGPRLKQRKYRKKKGAKQEKREEAEKPEARPEEVEREPTEVEGIQRKETEAGEKIEELRPAEGELKEREQQQSEPSAPQLERPIGRELEKEIERELEGVQEPEKQKEETGQEQEKQRLQKEQEEKIELEKMRQKTEELNVGEGLRTQYKIFGGGRAD